MDINSENKNLCDFASLRGISECIKICENLSNLSHPRSQK